MSVLLRLLLSLLLAAAPLQAADTSLKGPASVTLPQASGTGLLSAPSAALGPSAVHSGPLGPLLPPPVLPGATVASPKADAVASGPAVAVKPAAAAQLSEASRAPAGPGTAPVSAETSVLAAAAVFDASGRHNDAAPVPAAQCPFHRLLGLSGNASPRAGPAETVAPSTAAPKPRLLKFSLAAVAASALRYWKDWLLGRSGLSAAPHPKKISSLALAGLALTHIGNPARGLEALHARYGDTAHFVTPTGHRAFFLSHPDSVKRVLGGTDKHDDSPFEKSELGIGGIAQLTGRGTIFLGLRERWKHRMAIMSNHVGPKAARSEDMGKTVAALVEDGLDDLEQRLARTGGEVRVADEMSALTMRVILGTLFHYEAGSADLLHEVGPAFAEVTRTIPTESLNPFTVRLSELPLVYRRRKALKRAYALLDSFAGQILAAGRARPEPKGDLLDALLAAKGEDGKPLTDREIKNEILTLILAGHETTSSTLTWALSSLSESPAAMSRLRLELGEAPPKHLNLRKGGYPFLDQVIQETLRLYSPAYALFRRAKEDTVVATGNGGQVRVPKGSQLVLSTFVTHRRHQQWDASGHDAHKFHPERFDPDEIARLGLTNNDLQTFSFGYGPRACLGQALSLLETQLILTRLLQRFTLTPRPGSTAIASDIGIRRADGFPAHLRRR